MADGITSAVISAGIGAVSAISGILIRDLFVPMWAEKRKISKEIDDIFKLYAQPLAQSTERLFWRLDEIMGGRSQFLRELRPDDEFNNYKFISSCYRLAVFLGWMRAIDKEIARLPSQDDYEPDDIETSINQIRQALADGGDVEVRLVENLINIWGVSVNLNCRDKKRLGIEFNHEVSSFLFEKNISKMSDIHKISDEYKLFILSNLREVLHRNCGEHISDSIIEETKARASEAISIRAVWLYRDWQDAIADCFLVTDSSSARRYRPIGYADFEEIAKNKEHKSNLWYRRVSSFFDGIDISNKKFDMRVDQLQNIYVFTALLLLAINKNAPRNVPNIIASATLRKAESVATP